MAPIIYIVCVAAALGALYFVVRRVDEDISSRRRQRAWMERTAKSFRDNAGICNALAELGYDLTDAGRQIDVLKARLADEHRQRILVQRELAMRPPPHPIVTLLRTMGHPLTWAQLAHGTGADEPEVRRCAELLIAGEQLEPWVSRDGDAVDWEVIGVRLAGVDLPVSVPSGDTGVHRAVRPVVDSGDIDLAQVIPMDRQMRVETREERLVRLRDTGPKIRVANTGS